MAATFPGGVKPFTTKRNGPDGDVVDASHINDLQDEVVAIETELLKTAGSVIDHGSLSGLGDNDHPQYSKTDHVHTEYAGTNHNHDATYLGIAATAKDSDKLGGELPSAFSRTNHAHTGYAASDHNHDTTYAPKTHTHTEYVKNTGNETISGEKTFSSLPVLPTTAPTANNPIRKGYADSNYVGITGNQTVSGEKTFSTLPKVPTTTPTSNDQVASKAYVDSVAGGGSGGPYVDLTSDQSVGGVKTFTSIPLLPSSMPSLANQVTSKAYVDSVAGGGSGGISMQDVYPIGSVFMSMNSTNPATSLGFGTWSAVQGKFLVGVSSETEFNTAGKTGGAKTVTLSTANMPSHNHSISGISQGALLAPNLGSDADVIVPSGSMSTGYSGSGTAHNNLPPYFAIYIWTRTA